MKHYLLIKSPLFTYDLGRGGTPPTQRTNLRFAQIVEDLKNFNFGRPMDRNLQIAWECDEFEGPPQKKSLCQNFLTPTVVGKL